MLREQFVKLFIQLNLGSTVEYPSIKSNKANICLLPSSFLTLQAATPRVQVYCVNKATELYTSIKICQNQITALVHDSPFFFPKSEIFIYYSPCFSCSLASFCSRHIAAVRIKLEISSQSLISKECMQ
mgnify:CR=1 FL=1